MINFYKKLVIKGTKKWTAVPSLWREQVQEALKADGYTLNEDGTVSKTAEQRPFLVFERWWSILIFHGGDLLFKLVIAIFASTGLLLPLVGPEEVMARKKAQQKAQAEEAVTCQI